MYHVLLADDEKNITQWLSESIPWANLGVDEVYTAGDGLQALDILQGPHLIDLLITDIRMPKMDGITLLKAVRRQYPDIHCILLTAYGEFEYAMEAMKLGVDNYLMKPIQPEELTETIENALDNIYIRRKNMSTLFQENILRRWITGNICSDELGERAVLIHINIYQPRYCIIAMRKNDSSVSLSAFGQECSAAFPEGLETFCVWDNSDHFILLIGGREIAPDQLKQCMEGVASRYRLSDHVLIAVGPVVHDRMEVPSSYKAACSVLDNKETGARKSGIFCFGTEKQKPPKEAVPDHSNISPLVQRAVRYIHEHYAEGVSIREFCNALNINAAYLGYLFKKETGTYFNNYLNDFRMEKAKELLLSTGERINDIALRTGYTTASHFITIFKKKTGLSPLKYREIYGGDR